MQLDLTQCMSFTGAALGIASLVISSRSGALREQMKLLQEDLTNLKARLLIVENDRDTHKRDAEELRRQLLAALSENAKLKERLEKIKAALRARAQRK